jgi:hypothetical protein
MNIVIDFVVVILFLVLDEARLRLTQPSYFYSYFWFPGNSKGEVGVRKWAEGKQKMKS